MDDVTRTSLGRGAAEAVCLPAGFTLGPYRIERLLGRGGMGEVYEAEHLEHQRRVALKILTRRLEAEDREEFLSEGRIAASITHPNTVYVFGSETIEGVSVIAMELLGGGTLKDLVDREGPLSSGTAVDEILQVIAGLEAAHSAGILHRDVKPHNCFTAPDGTVKVGDFGLSISSAGRAATERVGIFQGTPQYAAPEQLRGEALDAGADIYAVGGTLYYLLTGRPPFDDQDFTTLIQRVKNETPRSPREVDPSVPKELAAIVLRCLAKDRAARPATYAALAADLVPFSSVAPQPAPLGPRFVAGAIDALILVLLLLVVLTPMQQAFGSGAWVIICRFLLFVSYFTTTEGLSGASRGKASLGLEVVDRLGRRAGVLRAAARAILFVGALFTVAAIRNWVKGVIGGEPRVDADPGPLASVAGITMWAAFAGVWFGGARMSNGFAAIHDRLTGTRVVQSPKGAIRQPKAANPIPAGIPGEAIGPYHLLAEQPDALPDGVIAAYDGVLNRFVWIVWTDDAAPSRERRDLSRPGRVRWLGGGKSGGRAWNAYEALHGAPLARAGQPRAWAEARLWLHDLADELVAQEGDRLTPVLALDRVWITTDSRARLVDWPATGESLEPRRFLYAAALAALQGAPEPLRVRIPLSARVLLDRLRAGSVFLSSARDTLAKLIREPADVTPRRRAIPLLLCGAPAVLVGLVTLGTVIANRADTATLLTDLSLFGGMLQASGAIALASAALFRGGVLLRFSGVGLVNRTGKEAPRWRAVLRAAAAWTPAFLFAAIVTPYRNGSFAADPMVVAAALLALGIFFTGAAYALSNPARSWQDRIAGTWLVPR